MTSPRPYHAAPRLRCSGLGALLPAVLVLAAPPLGAQVPDSAEAAPHGAGARDPHVLDVHEGQDFRVYDREGRVSSVREILEAALDAEVLLVGEEHEDRVGHSVELELLAELLGRLSRAEAEPRQLVLSLEMFEQDVQYVLDEYLAGLISEEHFLASARPWDNYVIAYRPLVEVARAHRIPVVASNAPRRYVARVTAEGPESLHALSPLAQSFLPPLPYPGPSERYREEWDRLMASDTAGAASHVMSPNAIQAQALWDAGMAYAVVGVLERRLDALVVHIAGSFHVARGTGIPERLVDYRPGTRVTSLVMESVEDVDAWDASSHRGLADFVVLTLTTPAR